MGNFKFFIDYLLRGFGFKDVADLNQSCWHLNNKFHLFVSLKWSAVVGIVHAFVEQLTGMPPVVLISFVLLVVIEVHTGMKAAKKEGEDLQSRKFGRMLFKVGYYVAMLAILFQLSTNKFPNLLGFEVDPFLVLYYIYMVGIVFQLVMSVMENFDRLGYKGSKSVLGIMLRHYNRIFKIEENAKNKDTAKPESD